MKDDLATLLRGSLQADTPPWLDQLVTGRAVSVVEQEVAARVEQRPPVAPLTALTVAMAPSRPREGIGARVRASLVRVGRRRVPSVVGGWLARARGLLGGPRAGLLGAGPAPTKGS